MNQIVKEDWTVVRRTSVAMTLAFTFKECILHDEVIVEVRPNEPLTQAILS